MKCSSFIHVYYYDFIEELHKMLPNMDKNDLGQLTLEALLIPDGGDAASYLLINPNKYLYNTIHRDVMSLFFYENFPEEIGIYIDID